MLNQVVLIGRIVNEEVIYHNFIEIVIPRYDRHDERVSNIKDYVNVDVSKIDTKELLKIVKKNDLLGFKGSLCSVGTDTVLTFVADKITFLTSK